MTGAFAPEEFMAVAILILLVLLLLLPGVAFLLGRHWSRRQYLSEQMSLVTRQHIHLFQGGQLNDELVEATKARFRDMLERGDVDALESSMRAGVQYVVQVRALAEIGTEEAGRILERQLHRRLTEDELEQSWYWFDLANGLRQLNRQESLPHLLRCSEQAGDVPLGQFFAAETVCFLGFSGYLQNTETALGRAALRVLLRALEGLRHGVPPQMVVESRLGEVVERMWDNRPQAIDPLIVRVIVETLRFIRRIPQTQSALPAEGTEQESFKWQTSRMLALEPVFTDFLDDVPDLLREKAGAAETANLPDILKALMELRAETASVVLPPLENGHYPHAGLAIDSLLWSKDEHTATWLRAKAGNCLGTFGRYRKWSKALGRRNYRPEFLPLIPLLRALRGHPGGDTEHILLIAAKVKDEECRTIALSGLGWWEPVLRERVLACLKQARRDAHPGIRQAARAALARLGERHSLLWFRQALTCEDSQQVHEAIQVVANENLTLLWPDLDRLADADNPDVAQHAREAVQCLFEEMEWDMRR